MGRLYPIIIIYNIQGNPESTIAAVGYTLSYYEFITENYNRLSDSEWNDILISGSPPRPSWIENIIIY